MKYNSNNKPLVCMQTQSTCYKGTSKMTIKGVLWHCTGANNPTLKRYVQPSDTKPSADTYSKDKWLEVLGKNSYNNDWNHISHQAGLNCWIGKLANGNVATVQTMPWDYKPWGCGSGSKGSCNDGWIQFEICEDGLTDTTYFNKVYTEACEITSYLCKLYNIDPKGTVTHNGVKVPTILCHYDSYKLGMGSNHGDVYNWFNKHNKTMDNVRNDVASLLKVTSNSISVKSYILHNDVSVYGSAADAKSKTNKKTTYKAGTYYVYNKYPDGVNGMLNISTDKTGDSAGGWINPSDNIKPATTTGKAYKVVTSLNRYATVTDAVNKQNSKGTYAVGTYYIYEKYPNGYNGMFNISSDSTGKSAGSWINPSENVLKESVQTTTSTTTSTEVVPPTKEPSIESTTKNVYELSFPVKHKICEWTTMEDTDYKKKFTQVCEMILKNNASFDVNIVKAFFDICPIYGIDPVRAISQSILETGWFKYQGSAVLPEHHNYCGLGVTVNGKPGNIFTTIEYGVRAQIQHLFAYGCKDNIPNGETLIDERFKYVTRGISPTWEELAGRWCVPGYEGNDPELSMKNGTTYGQKIDKIYESLVSSTVTQSTIDKYFPSTDNSLQQNNINKYEEIDTEKVNKVLDLLLKVLNFIVDFFKNK